MFPKHRLLPCACYPAPAEALHLWAWPAGKGAGREHVTRADMLTLSYSLQVDVGTVTLIAVASKMGQQEQVEVV